MPAEPNTLYDVLEQHVDELWLPDEAPLQMQHDLLDSVAEKIASGLSSAGLVVVAQEDVLTAEEAQALLRVLGGGAKPDDWDLPTAGYAEYSAGIDVLRRLSGP